MILIRIISVKSTELKDPLILFVEFDLFAEESVLADAADDLADREWIGSVIEEERRKYLPAIRQEDAFDS